MLIIFHDAVKRNIVKLYFCIIVEHQEFNIFIEKYDIIFFFWFVKVCGSQQLKLLM